MSNLRLQNISKVYGDHPALIQVSLEIRSGEFFSFLGPSGCGKTTLLRIISGLESPSNGRILIDGLDVTRVPPQRRETVMVFQNYALFPHMNVSENVGFGLETRKLRRDQIQERIGESLALVQLSQKMESAVQDLSGGEQQRVALARAIAVRPKILLMDEPLSNLDIALRAETRSEIKRLQKATGITTVYVTHDQEEALGLSDRIAVLHRGRMLQVGTPEQLYDRPEDVFVASFLGNANVFPASVSSVVPGGIEVVVNGELRFTVAVPGAAKAGDQIFVAVRPEHLSLVALNESYDFRGKVESKEFQGLSIEYRVLSENQQFRVIADRFSSHAPAPGEDVGVRIRPERCFIYRASED